MAEELKIVATAAGFDQVNKAIDNTAKSLDNAGKSAEKAGKALSGEFKASTNSASNAVTNLSRIVSDSAYGFIGIANNIQPFIDSLGSAKREAQAAGTSLGKNLLSVLSGPGGLSLAFAAITTAITFVQIGLSAWTRGSKEAADDTDNFKNRLEELKKELSSVTDNLNEFVKVAESALKLNDINIVARFSDKTEQGTLQRQAKFITISEELVKAQDARAQAFQNYLGIARSAYNTEEDFIAAQQEALKVYNELIKKENELADAREYQAAVNRAAVEEEKRANAERLKIKADKIYQEWLKGWKKLQEWFKKNRTTDMLSPYGESVDIQLPTFQFNTEELNQATRKGLIEAIKRLKLPTELLSEIGGVIGLENLSLEGVKKFYEKYMKLFADEAQKAKDAQIVILSDLTSSVIFTLTEGIGSAIVNGADGLKSVFQGIFNLFGDAAIQLGKNAILFSTAFAKLKKVLGAGNAVLGIGAGIALIAIGSIIKAGIGKLTPKFATGTSFAPGGLALVGERGPELVNIPRGGQVVPSGRTSQLMGGIESVQVYGILRGQDIYFSNKKYGQTYGRAT